MNIIEIHGLSRSFGTRQILNSVDLTLQKGEFVSIIGKSGSGKSTLINIIGLLDAGFTGSYQLLGEHRSNVRKYATNSLDSYSRCIS